MKRVLLLLALSGIAIGAHRVMGYEGIQISVQEASFSQVSFNVNVNEMSLVADSVFGRRRVFQIPIPDSGFNFSKLKFEFPDSGMADFEVDSSRSFRKAAKDPDQLLVTLKKCRKFRSEPPNKEFWFDNQKYLTDTKIGLKPGSDSVEINFPIALLEGKAFPGEDFPKPAWNRIVAKRDSKTKTCRIFLAYTCEISACKKISNNEIKAYVDGFLRENKFMNTKWEFYFNQISKDLEGDGLKYVGFVQ
jgi:hypothetical protein